MAENKQPEAWPLWVEAGLWGLPTRAAARAFVWLSLALAATCVSYGFWDCRFFTGGLLAVAALWYHLSIRWVDRHGDWG
jgi:hypothetical protein